MEITCYRETEVSREQRTLPATTYNMAVQLLARCHAGQLFVPIRSMQILAIIDAEEFVFIDNQHRCWVDIAWQNFHSWERNALDQSVTYDAVFYRENQESTMLRLQQEFPLALRVMITKERPASPARVIKFPAKILPAD
ncbi:MAG: hypothetical protein RQ714_07805 [Nitrosomonas sp.]|nr:hypothetical protein [Nitrosomonas sp.]